MAEMIGSGMNTPDPWPSAQELHKAAVAAERYAQATDLERIKSRFSIPPGFEQLALKIWYDGKYD